jgi:hypothetical protein
MVKMSLLLEDCCIRNIREAGFKLEKCPGHMAQRCARNWDDKCDIYLLQLDVKRNGNNFVDLVASKKYCRNVGGKDDEACVKSYKDGTYYQEDETSYTDPQKLLSVSDNFGNLRDFIVEGKAEITPLKAEKCDKKCDILNLANFGNDDRVLNECLDRGSCQEVMMNLAENLTINNIDVKNERMKKFIKGYIATNPADIQTRVLVGGKGPQVTTREITTPGPAVIINPEVEGLKPIAPSGFIKSKENFYGPSQEGLSQEKSTNLRPITIIIILLFVALIIGGGYKMYKKYKKY